MSTIFYVRDVSRNNNDANHRISTAVTLTLRRERTVATEPIWLSGIAMTQIATWV